MKVLNLECFSFVMVETIVMPAKAGIQVGSEEIKQKKTGFPLARE